MSLVKISELPATGTVLDTQEIPTNNAGVNEKITVGQIRNGSIYSITTDYNMSLTDGYTRIYFDHSPTTKLIQVNLPNVASSIGRSILFQNLDVGLSYVNGNGANIIFKNKTVTKLILVSKGDILILRSNGTAWYAEHYHLSFYTFWKNQQDWVNQHLGSAFTYDTKSAVVDFTGQKITDIDDGGSLQKALVVFDSGGTGNAGVLYVVNITDSATSKGVWTNNHTIQCGSGGYTCEVNEVAGSSKNVDYNIYHGLGINIENDLYLTCDFSSTGSYTSAYVNVTPHNIYNGAGNCGYQLYQIDINFLKAQTGDGGFRFIKDDGTSDNYTNGDYYHTISYGLKF